MLQKNINDVIGPITLNSIEQQNINIPTQGVLTHLQFRRFSGCPMCNLHLQSFIARHDELVKNSIQEVCIFHSSTHTLLKHHSQAPFALIGDPSKHFYKMFNVEPSLLSILHPKAMYAAFKGLFTQGMHLPSLGESIIGLPADFLIDSTGKIIALKYGAHAYDHWEFDEVLQLAQQHQR